MSPAATNVIRLKHLMERQNRLSVASTGQRKFQRAHLMIFVQLANGIVESFLRFVLDGKLCVIRLSFRKVVSQFEK